MLGGRCGTLLCGLALLAGCAGMPGQMEPLNVTLSDVRPLQVGLLEQEYAMKLRVQNPNNREIALQGKACLTRNRTRVVSAYSWFSPG